MQLEAKTKAWSEKLSWKQKRKHHLFKLIQRLSPTTCLQASSCFNLIQSSPSSVVSVCSTLFFPVVWLHLQFLFTFVINKSLLLSSCCSLRWCLVGFLPALPSCASPVSHLRRCFWAFEILKESAFILKTGSVVTHVMHIDAELVKQRTSLTPFPTH